MTGQESESVKLQHENPEESASKVTVHYDGHIKNLEVDDNGVVEVDNRRQAEELQESHGGFEPVSEEDLDNLPEHVLADKNVGEAQSYIQGIGDEERLKELRQKDDRKTVKQAVDNRLQELREPVQEEQEQDEQQETEEEPEQEEEQEKDNEDKSENQDDEEVEDGSDEVSNEDEEQDGEETENQ